MQDILIDIMVWIVWVIGVLLLMIVKELKKEGIL